MSLMPSRVPDNDQSAAAIGQSSVPARIPFRRLPGIPPVAVTRLAGDPPAAAEIPAGGHAHDFLLLFYAHRAHGTVVIDGRSWALADGQVFVISPGQVVSPADPAHRTVAEAWAVAFPADAVRPGGAGAYSSWRSHPLLYPFARGVARAQRFVIPADDRPAWDGRFAALDDELRSCRDGYHEAVLAHLTLLLVAVSRLSADVAEHLHLADEPLLAAVFEVIERRYHEPISLADVAADLALSAGHLTTVVRRKTGRTVQQWITERRMQQARALLTETDLTVAAIGPRVGYPDVSYFIRRFRADHGVTPARWRAPGPGTAGVTRAARVLTPRSARAVGQAQSLSERGAAQRHGEVIAGAPKRRAGQRGRAPGPTVSRGGTGGESKP
jgi:AraC family transcriptional activator of pobA